jgi:hypothetical protein
MTNHKYLVLRDIILEHLNLDLLLMPITHPRLISLKEGNFSFPRSYTTDGRYPKICWSKSGNSSMFSTVDYECKSYPEIR